MDKITNKIGWDENGGRWIGILGCSMESLKCEASGGIPIPGCMNTGVLSCSPECRFGVF